MCISTVCCWDDKGQSAYQYIYMASEKLGCVIWATYANYHASYQLCIRPRVRKLKRERDGTKEINPVRRKLNPCRASVFQHSRQGDQAGSTYIQHVHTTRTLHSVIPSISCIQLDSLVLVTE